MTQEPIEIVVVVDEAHSGNVAAVASGLRAAGMKVENCLAEIGTITGTVERGRLAAVRAVNGVASVEESREVRTQ